MNVEVVETGGWYARCADCGWETGVFQWHASAVRAGVRHSSEALAAGGAG